jgi:hypothetical protein
MRTLKRDTPRRRVPGLAPQVHKYGASRSRNRRIIVLVSDSTKIVKRISPAHSIHRKWVGQSYGAIVGGVGWRLGPTLARAQRT